MATNYELWTFQDVIEHLLDTCCGNDPSARNARAARRAIVECYREFPALSEWRYFQPRLRILTTASQTTGTIEYVHSTRTVTLTGATWPSDVLDYVLLIDQGRYEVITRTSSTAIVLDADLNPGQDVASGSSYELVKDTYALPDNFASLGRLQDVLHPDRLIKEQTLGEQVERYRLRTTAQPCSYAITRHPRFKGGMALIFADPPNTARLYEAPYIARPRPLQTVLYNAGTVTTTADSTALTGSGTTFVAAHAGCVLRVSPDATNLPTSVIGNTDNVFNPAALTRMVKTFTGTTALVLEQVADVSLAGMKYTLSDPIDLEHGAMLTAFLRMTEWRFELLLNKERANNRRGPFNDALAIAMEKDQRGHDADYHPQHYSSLASIASSVEVHPGE